MSFAKMRVGGWTLKLKTQVGHCRIAHTGSMRGVGTVWYYLEGAENALSQFIVASL